MDTLQQVTIGGLIFLISCALSACSPVKGYSGPELPPEQIATIYLDYDSDDFELSRATSNGIQFASQGITLLPGEIGIEVSGAAKGTPRNCERCYKSDEYSYRKCLEEYYADREKGKKHSTCDWDDYTEIREECDQDYYDSTCQISFRTDAGAAYDVHVYRSGNGTALTAARRGGAEPLGYGQCTTYREHVEPMDRYVGSGRYTSGYGARPCNY